MKEDMLSIKDVANMFNISEATCRNWIKSNNLYSKIINGKIFVLKSSVDELLKNNLNGKLSSRRNKIKKTGNILSLNYLASKEDRCAVNSIVTHLNNVDSIEKISYILKICSIFLLKKAGKYDEIGEKLVDDLYKGLPYLEYKNLDFSDFSLNDDLLGALYMCLEKISKRKSGGMYYTPANIVDSMFKNINEICADVNNKRIIDICCGTGNFLIKALKNGFNYKNINGRDSDFISICLTRINMYLRCDASYEDLIKNIKLSDSLIEKFDFYDFCVGNPPWGSVLKTNLSLLVSDFEVAQSDSIDPFCLFIEKGLKLLNPDGYLYYVCPEALCSVGIHKATRTFLMNNSELKYLTYLGNAFDGVQSPAIMICVKNRSTNNFALNADIKTSLCEYSFGPHRKLDSNLWDFNITNENFELIDKIYSIKNVQFLKDNALFALGIVTGNNKKYVLNHMTSKTSNLVKGSNIFKYTLKVGSCFLEYDRKNFQQVAPDDLYFAPEKLIYRFICDTLVFAYDNKQTLTLNSANICIPKFDNLSIKYVLAILNSRLSHFIFKLKYNSIKILRNHIESIPIIVADSNKIKIVESYVNLLLAEENNEKKELLYNELDDFILNLYHLSKDEKQIIKDFNKHNIFLKC